MQIADINVLVYAHHTGAARHREYLEWLIGALNGPEAFVVPEIVAAGFLRVTTNPRILPQPLSTLRAFEALAEMRASPASVEAGLDDSHFETFRRLCLAIDARGNDIPDAYLAAIAIEHDATLYSADRGFRRFPGLRWRHSLDG